MIEVCRVCFSMDSQLYAMTNHQKLTEEYEALTGLSLVNEGHLPRFLCAACVTELLQCAHFRTRSLKAHKLLLEIVDKHDSLTLESIESLNGPENSFKSIVKDNETELKSFLTQTEDVNDNHEPIGLLESTTDYTVKEEIDDAQSIDDVNIDYSLNNPVTDSVKDENEAINNDLSKGSVTESFEEFTPQDNGFEETGGEDYSSDDNLPLAMLQETAKLGSGTEPKTDTEDRKENIGAPSCNSYEDVDNQGWLLCDACPYKSKDELDFLTHLKSHSRQLNVPTEKQSLNPTNDIPFLCEVCGESFKMKQSIINHLQKHTVEQTYSCAKCYATFKYKNLLKRHLLNSIFCQNYYICDICNTVLSYKSGLIRHIRAHSIVKKKPEPVWCDICNRKFKSKVVLRAHLTMHYGMEQFVCHVCNKGFKRKGTLKKHKEQHYDRILYECDICQKTLVEKRHLIYHLKTHDTKRKRYSCDICEKVYIDSTRLKRHLDMHKGLPEPSYQCGDCDKTFTNKSSLCAHSYVHKNKDQYPCKICNKTFHNKSRLKNHSVYHSGVKAHTCVVCKKSFTERSTMLIHLERHKLDFVLRADVKIYACELCLRVFNNETSYLDHKKITHPEKRPYQCDICKKTFPGKINISHHMVIHSTKKPHMCDVCGKSFSRTNYLTVHKKLHTGLKQFICDYCNKAFVYKKALQQHILIHTKKLIFKKKSSNFKKKRS